MAAGLKRRAFQIMFLAVTVVMPLFALAKEDEETAKFEARLEGYATNVRLPGGSTALLWLLVIFLAVVAVAALFKNARRTHLD